ncbi:CBS domain-containing protein [Paenibacillus herberti]|uniref:CBS domain-containing protein n=2 Tax=Paenibacillus herberti TaxID=1619309 RepID=A0A229P0W4_9BACL|nr:CBS domain-containing protein [Paenibacillus herberti]
MTRTCYTATLKDNVYELAVLMKEHGIGFVPIVEGDKLIGVVTDRDLVLRGYGAKHPGSTAVREVMTADPITVSPDVDAEEAAELMASRQIRRLAVVDGDGKLAGVLSIGDLAVNGRYRQEAGEALGEISESPNGSALYH